MISSPYRTKLLATAAIVAAFVLVAGTVPGAQAITIPTQTGSGTALTFESLKQSTLALINSAVNKLNAAEATIQNNPHLTSDQKTQLTNSLNKIESALLSYKTKVEQATTIEELKAINQEIVQYLKDNKDVIRQNLSVTIAKIGENAAAKAEEFKQQVEQLLKFLEVTCPSQASTINTLEQQITELEADIQALTAAAKEKDVAAVKAKMKEMNTLIQSMTKNIKTIQTSCNLPQS